jgi:Protein of unknown function (DUF3443)
VRSFSLGLFLTGLLFVTGCGSSAKSSSSTTTTTPTGNSDANVMAISVNGGPTASEVNGSIYENGAFASATICAPGSTTNCATIGNLLVDTGSTGLRVFQSSVAALNLPALDASNGAAAYDCVNFIDGAFLWGPVQQADVTLGGETAHKLPIQVISSTNTGIPTSCSNGSTLNENTAEMLGANGIIGIGLEPTDCFYAGGSVCTPTSGLSTPPAPAYYTCTSTACSPAFAAISSQVTNPVVLFPTDNNGVIVELPAVSGSALSVGGSVVFGIGTETNNQISSSATILTLACNDFTTVFNGQTYGITDASTCAGPGSFIDSGSNALLFPNATNIPACSSNTAAGDLSEFYCPSSTETLSATNEGEDGKSIATNFSVANAETLFTSPTTAADAAMNGLTGENPSGAGFDWGLPFFYGVNVYNAIDGQPMPAGAPAAPWWAY